MLAVPAAVVVVVVDVAAAVVVAVAAAAAVAAGRGVDANVFGLDGVGGVVIMMWPAVIDEV